MSTCKTNYEDLRQLCPADEEDARRFYCRFYCPGMVRVSNEMLRASVCFPDLNVKTDCASSSTLEMMPFLGEKYSFRTVRKGERDEKKKVLNINLD